MLTIMQPKVALQEEKLEEWEEMEESDVIQIACCASPLPGQYFDLITIQVEVCSGPSTEPLISEITRFCGKQEKELVHPDTNPGVPGPTDRCEILSDLS